MAGNEPTTSVGALTAKIAQSLANIDKQRKAMAQVKAQIAANPAPIPVEGVTKT